MATRAPDEKVDLVTSIPFFAVHVAALVGLVTAPFHWWYPLAALGFYYLRMFGITAGGWVMARQAVAARALGDDDPYAAAKVATARFYCTELLPQAAGLLPAVRAGADLVLALPATDLASR